MAKLTSEQIYGMGVKWVKKGTYTYKGKTYNSYNDMYKVVEADYNAKNNSSSNTSSSNNTTSKDAFTTYKKAAMPTLTNSPHINTAASKSDPVAVKMINDRAREDMRSRVSAPASPFASKLAAESVNPANHFPLVTPKKAIQEVEEQGGEEQPQTRAPFYKAPTSSSLGRTVERLENEIIQIDKELRQLRGGGVAPEQSNLDKYNEKLNELYAKRKELNSAKANLGVTKYREAGVALSDEIRKDDKYKEYVAKGEALGTQNKVALLRNNPERMKAYEDSLNSTNEIVRRVLLENNTEYKLAKYGTKEQVETYYAYLGKGDTENAKNYLKYIDESLNIIMGNEIAESKDSILSKLAFGVTAGTDQFQQGMTNIVKGVRGDDYIPASPTQVASSKVRESLKYKGPEFLGASLGQGAYDFITTTSNMAPSIGASFLANAIVPGSGAVVGTSLMGGSAAGNSYQEKLNSGWTKSQAATYATIVGVSEAGLQYAMGGIGALGGKITGTSAQAIARGIDNAALRFVATYGMKMTSEGLEEALQEVLNPFFENIALGYKKNKWSDIEWEQVAYSGMLGALSAGLLEGGSTAVEVFGENKGANIIDKHLKEPESIVAVDDKAINEETPKADSPEKVATPPETTPDTPVTSKPAEASVPETLEQAAREVVESRNTKTTTSPVQMVENLSKGGQKLTVDEAKEASGYGDAGAKVLTDLVNNAEGKSFSQVKGDMHTSYLAGLSNSTIKSEGKVNMEAYLAGKTDREMSKIKATEGIFNNRVFSREESGLITPESKNKGDLNPAAVPKTVSRKMAKALDVVGKALGRKVMFVDSISVNGKEDGAHAQVRSDGVFEISVKSKQPLYELLFHEPLHIMRQENTAEYHAFVDFAVQHAEYLGLRLDTGNSRGTKFEGNIAQYQQYDLSIGYDANIEEIAAHFAEKLARGDRDAIRLIEKMDQDSNYRSGVQKFFDTLKDIIDKCVELWNRLKKQGEYAAAEELGITISELKKAKELYAKALTATAEKAQRRADNQKAEKSSESLENQGNKEYNGSTSYAVKAQRGRTIELETMENNRFERLRQFGDNLPNEWYAYTRDFFYIYANHSYMDYTILVKARITDSNKQAIKKWVEVLTNDVNGSTGTFNSWISSFKRGRGRNSWHSVSTRKAKTSRRTDGMDVRSSRGDNSGDIRTGSEYSEPEVKRLYKDSEGNTLTEAQQEYFKDSKVRDEDGNLLVVYHGTRKADFTVFKSNVNFFTDSKEMADSYSPNGEMFNGYLNITKPYEIDAAGEKWSKIPVDEATKKFLQEYGASVFKEGGKWRTTPADIASAIEEAVDNGEMDYDGIIIKNIDDTGSYYKGNEKHIATDYISFNSNQFKNSDNTKPTSNPDVRFSLKKSVEETKDLIAVHNLWEDKLLKSLNLGGLPMPSIAIVRAKEGHNNFGDISLVFNKETIDPSDKRNKVYSADGWTPTYPHIEYKLNETEQSKIEKKIDALVPKDVQRALGGVYLDAYNMEHSLNRSSDMVSSYMNNYAMRYAFLRDSGIDIDLPMKNASLSSGSKRYDEAIIKVAETIPEEVLLNAINGNDRYESEPAIRNAVAEAIQEKYKDKPVVANALVPKEELSLGQLMGYAEDALRYKEEGIKQEVDYKAASDIINEKTDTTKYEKWLKELFSNIIAKEGIRNDKDLFTPSGNRRSFEALHYEHTLENVVKVMKQQDAIGIGGFGGNTILGSSVVEYGSISEIKEKSNERMRALPQEEYEKIREGFIERFFELASSMPIHKDSFSATDDAANMLCEAVMKYKTKSGMANYLRNESKGWANYSDYIVDDLIALVNDIRNMPTSYFEAKPQRAVDFNEITTAIIPDNSSEELKSKLAENNIQFVEYEANNEDARVEALNSLEGSKFSLKKTADLSTKDTKELLDIIEHLKGEFEVTKFAKADPKKLAKMTKDLLKEYSSQADLDKTTKAIDDLYQYLANGEDGHPAAWNEVYSKAYEIAENIINNALVVDDELYTTYKGLREYLRKTPIKFDSRYDSVPSGYDNYQDFRRRNWGRFNFTKNGTSIDKVYQELSDLYPEFFNADEQINPQDQFERIVDVLDEIQPTKVNPYSSEMQQMTSFLANDIIDRFFDVPQAKPTFADKAERRVTEARIAGGKKVEAVRQQKDEKIQKLLDKQRVKTKNLLEKAKTKKAEAVNKEKAKREKAISNMKESQKAKVLRARIFRHTKDLDTKLRKGTDNKHIPDDLVGMVSKLLESINLESNYTYDVESGRYKKNDNGLPTKRTKEFEELRKLYSEIASSVVVDPDLLGDNGLLSDVILLADKRVVDMNSTELETVWKTICAVEASISTANKMFSKGKYETIFDVAEKLWNDNNGKKGKYYGPIRKGLNVDMLTPETFLHYLGDAGDSMFRMMRDAQDKHISIMKEVADFTHKTLKDVNVNSLEKTIHTVTLGGEEVQLSTAQLMELYVLVKREQAIDHIFKGGILPDVIAKKKKLTRAEPIRNISMAEISGALANLTDDQKKVADKLQRYVSTVLSEYGNEASMQVYNYRKFNEQNYWTIRTNKQEIQSEIGKDTAVTSVANKGMTKATKPHANTSVRIGSIFDTFSSHSSDMATYAAWLGTSEDINRIRNFVFWNDNARVGTVKGILDTVHGTKGSAYLEKLLTDIAIGVQGVDSMNPFDKLAGTYKAASVGANIRVIIQQPTAILRAMDMIGAQHLTAGAYRPLKGWEKAKKYAPIAQWKDWGYFDINTGRQMKDILFDNASVLEKTKQAGMWGASMADSLAWGQLWNAVESETKAKHKGLEVGSEEFYEAVAKRFTEIVDHTQVVDGIMQRSQFMRSADGVAKMATSFMGEPTKQYNMAISALHDAKNSKGDARKKAYTKLGRSAMSLAVAGIVNACAQSIIDAMRDDDKEEKYWEKWLAAFVGNEDDKWFQKFGNLGDTFNPLTYVPYAKDILSVVQGYDVKRMDMESISKMWSATENLYKAITKTGKYTLAEASASFFAELGRLYGVPVANVKRDIKSAVMTFAIETDNYLMQYRMEKAMLDINYAGNSKNFVDILFNAYNNDSEAYELIYKDMLKSGYDADKIKSGMETRMKKAEGVTEASELKKRYMTPETEKKYDSSLKRVQASQTWKSASSTQRKEAEAHLYSFLTEDGKEMEATRAEARALGIDETEYTLWKLAGEMVNADGKGDLKAKEKAAAIQKLDLDSNTEWDLYLFNIDEDKAKGARYAREQGVSADIYADFKEMLYEVDKPTKSGTLGTFTQDEVTKAIRNLNGLSQKEKRALWQSENLKSKKNPF